jgi:hypothetical protein
MSRDGAVPHDGKQRQDETTKSKRSAQFWNVIGGSIHLILNHFAYLAGWFKSSILRRFVDPQTHFDSMPDLSEAALHAG